MFGCREIIPPHLQDFDWSGTDNASWLMRMKKKIQYWLAIGPRGKHWYCKTRELPKTLFVINGGGPLRYETTDGKRVSPKPKSGFYLSRIQCWCRFHFAIQSPYFIQCHFIYRQKDVPTYPTYQSDFGITKMFSFHVGYKRDADRWSIPTVFAGGNHE